MRCYLNSLLRHFVKCYRLTALPKFISIADLYQEEVQTIPLNVFYFTYHRKKQLRILIKYSTIAIDCEANEMTEKEKMVNGFIYDTGDEELDKARIRAQKLCNKFNRLAEGSKGRIKILNKLVPENNGALLRGPIFFDYGTNISFGSMCFANFNFAVMDCAKVTIGDNVFFGPNVTIATPMHSMLSAERNMFINEKGTISDFEYAKPITIESDCWIASNVVICGGVTIKQGSVIGAGSIVTKDVPAGVFAAGSPCKTIRKLTEQDSMYLRKDLSAK